MTLLWPDARFLVFAPLSGESLHKSGKKRRFVDLSRRRFLQLSGQGASLAFLPSGLGFPSLHSAFSAQNTSGVTEFHLHPQYRQPPPLAAILSKAQAGFDEFVTEKYHDQIAAILSDWTTQLLSSPQAITALENAMAPTFSGTSPLPTAQHTVRQDSVLRVSRAQFNHEDLLSREVFLTQWRSSMALFSRLFTAEFQVTSIRAGTNSPISGASPDSLETRVRFEFVGTGANIHRQQRIGNWQLDWDLPSTEPPRLRQWKILDETRASSSSPIFIDITREALGNSSSYASQLLRGTDYWRTMLDGASGIDIYGHNGVSAADIDGDGLDDLYICQPAGLPNRLYRNRGDGTFEDITESSGLGILENTACALFADIDNDGRQDLILVSVDGPSLFLNQGGGKFRLRPDAFHFVNPPQGAFTGAAIADYDRDGWLDIYFCLYSYYQGADQYRYPSPYYDAENGPPNFLMRNQRDGTFRDVTRESGLSVNNTRFSFCCAWGDPNNDDWPDLYVVNDFGRKNLYRNNGDGTFTDIAPDSGVEDIGAGMGVCWLDYDNDSRQDLYVADMWTAAGLRVSEQEIFQKTAGENARALYRKHAMGNSLFHNRGGNRFEDATAASGSSLGRWSWCSDSWDFDHDGFPDIYIANGMISGPNREDLNSFFWRQAVAHSPGTPKPSSDYEQAWNAINELIRSDSTWSGYERNVFYLNNRDGSFSDVSGVLGLDFIEDSRSFALADFDQDGRLEVILKNRNAPQLRILKNVIPDLAPSIAFRLRGTKSNRDAIGAAVTVVTGSLRQTRLLQAGSGFLAQHSKELFFGLADAKSSVSASIRWPSGLQQEFRDLPLNHRIFVEEGSPSVRVEAFRKATSTLVGARDSRARLAVPPEIELLPTLAETWLLAPISAPDFSLPDFHSGAQTLSSRRGKPALLYFWSANLPCCQADLAALEKSRPAWTQAGLQLLAINVDTQSVPERDSAVAAYRNSTFPVLLASRDVLAIYNILFRHLFDRHRDLPLPTSFLVDANGLIVKVYQGSIAAAHVEADFHSLPLTAKDRLAKALPFPGIIDTPAFTRNYLSIGSTFYERGYLDQAEASFQQALRDDPSSAEALYGLGSVYLQQQKSPEARRSFQQAVQLRSGYPGTLPKAWNNLGILDAREGRTSEAIQNFQRALKIDPEYVVALVNLGNAYRQDKNWKEAQRVLQQAVELDPADPEANYSLGMVFAQLNDTGRAYEHLQKALAARPAYPEALNNLGVLYLRTRRPEEAEKTFQESIRLSPDFDQSYLNLARLYVVERQPQKAREVLLALLKQHPGHPQAQKELADIPP